MVESPVETVPDKVVEEVIEKVEEPVVESPVETVSDKAVDSNTVDQLRQIMTILRMR